VGRFLEELERQMKLIKNKKGKNLFFLKTRKVSELVGSILISSCIFRAIILEGNLFKWPLLPGWLDISLLVGSGE